MRPEARGKRIILSLQLAKTYLDLAEILRAEGSEFQHFELPNRLKGPAGMCVQYSNERARTLLGMNFRPLKETVIEMARDLVKRGIVKPNKPVETKGVERLVVAVLATCGLFSLRLMFQKK